IRNWDVSSAVNMYGMFMGAYKFNKDISGWNTWKVSVMAYMFSYTDSFNQDLGKWDISSASDLTGMFMSAKSFNQVLKDWAKKFKSITDLEYLFSYSGMSVEKYDSNLIVFYNEGPYSLYLGAHNLKYCNALTERIKLTETVFSGGKGWSISSDRPFTPKAALTPKNSITKLKYKCNHHYLNPKINNQHLLYIDVNNNLEFKPKFVEINHNIRSVLPTNVSSINGYYQITNANDTTMRVGNRMLNISATGWYSNNGGVIVRFYYDSSEFSKTLNDATPNNGGKIIESGWFRSNFHSTDEVLSDLNAAYQTMPNAVKINPIRTGKEDNIHYAEFLLNEFGTIGYYAKTNTL
ncbi:MAG: BspA family leucine-rich repeat surface protein, partial [Candidatus Paceibacterota bacterium]